MRSGRRRAAASPDRARLPRGRDPDAASRSTAAPTPGRSSPTSTPTTSSCTCASRPSCSSSGSCRRRSARVFELNRNFRNEGADGTHNPEFTIARGVRGLRRLRRRCATLTRGPDPRGRDRASRRAGRPPAPDGATSRPRRRRGRSSPSTTRSRRRPARARRPRRPSVEELRGVCAPTTSTLRSSAPLAALVQRAVRRPRRAGDDGADVLPRLPDRGLAAGPPAPRRPAAGRALGPRAFGARARHRLLRAHRPGRSAGAGSPRSRCDAAAGDPEAMELDEDFLAALEFGDAADRRPRARGRPAGDADHRDDDPRHPGVPVLSGPPGRASTVTGAASGCANLDRWTGSTRPWRSPTSRRSSR